MPIRIPGTKSSLTKAEVELPQLYISVSVIQVFVLMHPYKKYMHSRSGPRIHVTLSNNNNKINISGSNSNIVNDWANGLQLRSCVKTKLPTDVFFLPLIDTCIFTIGAMLMLQLRITFQDGYSIECEWNKEGEFFIQNSDWILNDRKTPWVLLCRFARKNTCLSDWVYCNQEWSFCSGKLVSLWLSMAPYHSVFLAPRMCIIWGKTDRQCLFFSFPTIWRPGTSYSIQYQLPTLYNVAKTTCKFSL